jgi:hypothetical protein
MATDTKPTVKPTVKPATRTRTRKSALPAVAAAAAVAAPPAPIATTGMDLLRLAMERNATPEQLGQFMDLVERQRKAEAEQGYVRAMVAFKKVAPSIVKDAGASFDAKNRQTGEKTNVNYDYATLGHICEQIIVCLAEAGISHDWSVAQPGQGQDANMICTTCTLTHELGHSKSATVKFPADPTGSKNPLQAIGSAITYGERYSLLAVCGIAVKEQGDDDGRAAGEPLKDQEPNRNPPQERRQQPRNTTYVTRGQHPLQGQDLANALRQIKAGKYDYQSLVGYYALTRPQLVQVHAELGMPAPADEVPA